MNRELDELASIERLYHRRANGLLRDCVAKYQHRMIDLLTDMMRPRLAEDDFQTERQVILEEIAKYEDQPPFGAFERAMELHLAHAVKPTGAGNPRVD